MKQQGYDNVMGGQIEVDEINSFVDEMTRVNQHNGRLWELQSFTYYFYSFCQMFSCPSVSLHSWVRRSLFFHMRTTQEFPRMVFWNLMMLICADVWVCFTAFKWIVLEFDSMQQISNGLRIITRNPSMQDFFLQAFIESTSEWTSSPFTKNFA